MNERPSGWYDDPDDDTQLRYWDGILWSDRTMPTLRPGLDHVGEARPVQHVEEPPRRDGEPRTYPAHWGPEQAGRRDEFHGPQFQGSQPGTAPFGNTVGQPSGLIRRILATFLDTFGPARQRYAELQNDPAELERILQDGAERARAEASQLLQRVRRAVGVP